MQMQLPSAFVFICYKGYVCDIEDASAELKAFRACRPFVQSRDENQAKLRRACKRLRSGMGREGCVWYTHSYPICSTPLATWWYGAAL